MNRRIFLVGGLAVLIAVVLQQQLLTGEPVALRGQTFKTLVNEPYNEICGDFNACTHECKCYDVMLDMGDGTSMPSTECQVEPRESPYTHASCGAEVTQCGMWMLDGMAENGQSYCQCTWFDDPSLCTAGDTGDTGTTTGDTGDSGDSGTATGGDTGSDTSGDSGDTGDTGTGFDPDGDPDPDPCDNVDCNDNNACTSDSCNDGACKNTPLNCNDGDACTSDSCVNGSCVNTAKNCNDNNSCTSDSCSAGQCINAKIESPECGTCENEPVCQEFSQPCYVSTPNMVDANGCITQCGTCILHPLPPYDPEKPEQPRCPTPICAPIPEGCSATDSGVDSDGCPIDPCGYTCPAEPECSDPPPECENIDTYHLDKNPDCKQNGEDACGCPSFHCSSTAPVKCCSEENVCTVFEVETPYGEDEEQYWAETDWMMELASQMDSFDESASPEEKRAFCENLGNNNPRPQPTVEPTSETAGDTGSDTSSSTSSDTSGSTSSDTSGDTGTDADPDSGGENDESDDENACPTLVCDAPPDGCIYDLTATVEGCTCPPLACEADDNGAIAGADSGATGGANNDVDGGTDDNDNTTTTFSSSSAPTSSSSRRSIVIIPDVPIVSSSSSTTSTVSSVAPLVCGDGYINQPFEQCDDGNLNEGDGCSSTCQIESDRRRDTRSTTQPVCGDGVLQYGEQCDDSNTQSDDGCSSSCALETGIAPVCGDTILTIGEECDYGPANKNLPNYCRPDCTMPVCGDGIIDDRLNEECDDGNVFDNDGCSATCFSEQRQIANVPAETPTLVAAAAVCGNGVLEPGEQCDDANMINSDGCNRYCEIILSENNKEPADKPSAPLQTSEPNTNTLVAGESETSPSVVTDTYPQVNQQLPSVQGALTQSDQAAYQQQMNGLPSFPNQPNEQQVSRQLPLAQLQPLIRGRAPAGDTGPATVAVMGAGMAAGFGWMRRKRR